MSARLFTLVRTEDVSGVSGVSGLGTVAEGIVFTDGRVALRWCVGAHRSTVTWDSIDAVIAVHGHDGRTTVQWADDPANDPFVRTRVLCSLFGRRWSQVVEENKPYQRGES